MTKYKTPFVYGFLVALAGSILMISLVWLKLLGPKATSLNYEMVGGTILFLMLYLFLLFAIYYAIKERKERLGNQILFKQALVQGIIVSLSTAVFSVIFTILYYEIIYPNYVDEMMMALRDKMSLTGVSEDRIVAKLEEKKAYYSTASQSFYSFIGNLVTGTSFTLLLSFFIKSKTKS